jgi:hypothetical protein
MKELITFAVTGHSHATHFNRFLQDMAKRAQLAVGYQH